MNLNELAKEIYQRNVEKGFYEKPVETGTRLMLITSELAEALEADRKNQRADLDLYYELNQGLADFKVVFNQTIKDTFEDELADALIRILDCAAHMNINIQKHVELKMQYNQLRPHKHGKNY